jgi:hypothetical protein
VRTAYLQLATVTLEPGSDVAALGAAVTKELCGSWEHPPPCPLAPHHTRPERNGNTVTLRVIFATEPANEVMVRDRINSALGQGSLTGPDGRAARWEFLGAAPGELDTSEAGHARRLIDS